MKAPLRHLLLGVTCIFVMNISTIAFTKSNENGLHPIVLKGILKTKVSFGPPGFGEDPKNDTKIKTYYLILQNRISSRSLGLKNRKKAPSYFNKVQVWCGNQFTECDKFMESHKDKEILASGEVNYALEANDIFPIVMTAESLDDAGH